MTTTGEQLDLAGFIRAIPDFPSPGIVFRDVTPLLASPTAFRAAIDALARDVGEIDAVIGIESRGFILGAPVALELGAAFIPARKAGKLPGDTVSVTFSLEYGEAELELQAGSIGEGQRVLIVDDVLATGGTAAACGRLVQELGGVVAGYRFLLELEPLGGRQRLGVVPYRALLTY